MINMFAGIWKTLKNLALKAWARRLSAGSVSLFLSLAIHLPLFLGGELEPKLPKAEPVSIKVSYRQVPKVFIPGLKKSPKTGGESGKKLTYGELFPKLDAGSVIVSPQASESSEGVQYGKLDSLSLIARQLSDGFYIPSALIRENFSGSAVAKVRRKKDGFKVTYVNGSPYFRALLYERLKTFLESDLPKLDQDGIKKFSVDLNFVKIKKWQPGPSEKQVALNDKKISIHFTFYESIDGGISELGAVQTDEQSGKLTTGINVLAPILMLLRAAEDPDEDRELKELRKSPAFASPFRYGL